MTHINQPAKRGLLERVRELLPQSIRGAVGIVFLVGAAASVIVTLVAAWGTHVVWCLLDERYLLLIAGAILAPIGIIHGIGLWFGWF